MTIKDLDTMTLLRLNTLCNDWYVRTCPDWLTHFIDKDCQDCQIGDLCYLIDCYDNDIRRELDVRGAGKTNGTEA